MGIHSAPRFARVDADDAHVLRLARHGQIVAGAVAGHAHVVGREAEHDHQLAVLQRLERAVAPRRAVHVGVRAEADGRARIAAVARDLAAQQVEQTEERVVHHDVLFDARAFLHEHGLVAVLLGDARELARDGVKRLVPADALILAVAALRAGHTAHRVVQAVVASQPAADGSTAQACAGLDVAEFRGAGGVRLHVGQLAVLHVALQHAGASAVDVAVRPHDLLAAVALVGVRLGSGHVQRARAAAGGERSQRAGRCDERAAG